MTPARAVVVHYRGLDRLRACVESLLDQDHGALKVTVVDHAPESEALAAGNLPRTVDLRRPATNSGFGGGVATALRGDTSPVVLLLNPDARAEHGWARGLTEALESAPRTGMAACRIGDGRHPDTLDSAGLTLTRGGMALLRGHGSALTAPVEELVRLPLLGPAGSAAGYRREMIDDLGGFPAAYFLYYEDVEIAFRARRRGWDCAWVDACLAVHDHDSSAGADKRYYLQRGRRLFLHRNWPPAWRNRFGFEYGVEETATWGRALARGDLEGARRARRDAADIHAAHPFPEAATDGPADAQWLAPPGTAGFTLLRRGRGR